MSPSTIYSGLPTIADMPDVGRGGRGAAAVPNADGKCCAGVEEVPDQGRHFEDGGYLLRTYFSSYPTVLRASSLISNLAQHSFIRAMAFDKYHWSHKRLEQEIQHRPGFSGYSSAQTVKPLAGFRSDLLVQIQSPKEQNCWVELGDQAVTAQTLWKGPQVLEETVQKVHQNLPKTVRRNTQNLNQQGSTTGLMSYTQKSAQDRGTVQNAGVEFGSNYAKELDTFPVPPPNSSTATLKQRFLLTAELRTGFETC
ncbi:hypothetical protein C8J56DRAFT_897364 [Mycena floridula]|nr:hypothetical protein C8J56DRAFT_897364 [Mycena floridula]